MPHRPRKRTEQGPERRKEKEAVPLQPSWGVLARSEEAGMHLRALGSEEKQQRKKEGQPRA